MKIGELKRVRQSLYRDLMESCAERDEETLRLIQVTVAGVVKYVNGVDVPNASSLLMVSLIIGCMDGLVSEAEQQIHGKKRE